MGFERCHPAVNFLYFAAVIAGTILFQHPVFLAISVVCAFLYSIKRSGWKAAIFNTVLLIFAAGFALYYSSYHHFGVTVLRQNFIGNNMTLEALVYGFVLGLSMTGVMIWFSCVHSVFTTDKVVYLFGRISPRLSLFLTILLRLVPRIKKEARRINTAQQGTEGHAVQNRFVHFAITASISSMVLGIAAERFSQPVSVTRQLSSSRKPMPHSSW